VLEELGALDEERRLTPLGRRLARFPVDPRIGRMILAGAELGCLADVLVVTAALNTQDPRERPRDAQQQADEVHRRFRDERSDFLGLLKLWAFVQEQKGSSALRRACKANFLSFMRVREWIEVHRQLLDIVRELKLDGRPQRARPTRSTCTARCSPVSCPRWASGARRSACTWAPRPRCLWCTRRRRWPRSRPPG
jgi:ATP-dependent helicase HrpA